MEHKPAQCCNFVTVTWRLTPMTLKLEGNLDILKMYPHIENKAAGLRHSKLKAWILKNIKICLKVKVQDVKSSELLRQHYHNIYSDHAPTISAFKVKGHQLPTTTAFTMGDIPIKLHQFLISSFQDFVQTDRQTHRQTDAAKSNNCLPHSWHAGNDILM